jgi:hypothetical protein
VVDSLGPIVDRESENLLGAGDYGMRRLRAMYPQAVETVRAGGDPPSVVRDATRNRLIVIPAHELLISDEQKAELVPAEAGH